MTDLARCPVVVGAGQVTNRETDPGRAPSPFDLMVEAARLAAADAGGRGRGRLGDPASLTHCWMVHSLSVRHGDPAGELARRLGATGAEARCSGMGGNVPQWLVNRAADEVRRGTRPVVLVVGAEALATRRRAKKAGMALDWPTAPGWPETWPPLDADFGVHPTEAAHGLADAITMYALVESAVAHAAGHGPTAHARAIGELFSAFGAVGAANPNSWFRGTVRSAEELVTPGPDNRMVSTPYTKYLTAVMDVDMAAAVLVTDAATARDAGLDGSEVAHLQGWGDATDVWHLSARPTIDDSPALAAGAAAALAGAGLGIDDVECFDLYACFPSAVEVARDVLGIGTDDPRPLTLTGGLPIHGGPGSNYVTHAVANTLAHVRAGGGPVLVHGNGYYLTKQSVGIYGGAPADTGGAAGAGPGTGPGTGTGTADVATGDGERFRPGDGLPVLDVATGPGRVIGATVPYRRDGEPDAGIVLLDVEGGRTVARADAELTAALLDGDRVGTSVSVVAGGVHDGPGGNVAGLP